MGATVVTSHAYFQIAEIQVNIAHRLGFPPGIYSEIHSPITTQEIPCVMALILQPIRDFPLHSGEPLPSLAGPV